MTLATIATIVKWGLAATGAGSLLFLALSIIAAWRRGEFREPAETQNDEPPPEPREPMDALGTLAIVCLFLLLLALLLTLASASLGADAAAHLDSMGQ